MKIAKTLSPALKTVLLTQQTNDNNRALYALTNGRHFDTIIPMHVANMRILTSDISEATAILPVIIPAMAIYLNESVARDGLIARDAIGYKIASNHAAFPLSHVFDDSGWLCLGNIFVPARVPLHSPQQPLETLFLHNDRNLAHGHPHLHLTRGTKTAIGQLIREACGYEVVLPFEVQTTNWVAHDVLWRIGHYLLVNLPTPQAYRVMSTIFALVFPKPKPKGGSHD